MRYFRRSTGTRMDTSREQSFAEFWLRTASIQASETFKCWSNASIVTTTDASLMRSSWKRWFQSALRKLTENLRLSRCKIFKTKIAVNYPLLPLYVALDQFQCRLFELANYTCFSLVFGKVSLTGFWGFGVLGFVAGNNSIE